MESISGKSRFLLALRRFGEEDALMKSRLLVLLLVSSWLWHALVIADEARWEQYMRAGMVAYQRGDYEEVVGQDQAALNDLADIYRAHGQSRREFHP